MGMENHVLLGQQNQDVVTMSVLQEINCRHYCTKLEFVIKRHSLYPFLLVTTQLNTHTTTKERKKKQKRNKETTKISNKDKRKKKSQKPQTKPHNKK
jgi:hypothetical protein